MQQPEHFLISRTDSIGDVVLTLPMAGALKKQFPSSKVSFLGKNYTKDLVEASVFVDQFVDYDALMMREGREQVASLKSGHFSACIHVFPRKPIACLAKKAGIPIRIGTTSRLVHWFTCNRPVMLSRHNSDLHEAQLNLKLLKPLGITSPFALSGIPPLYGVQANAALPANIRSLLSTGKKNIILHPKSQGSGMEWGLQNFGTLIRCLDERLYRIFITGTSGERPALEPLLKVHPQAVDVTGAFSLAEFMAFVNACDALVASSTGPLHVAAALGRCAIGLFPNTPPIGPGRWAPLGANAQVVMMQPDRNEANARLEIAQALNILERLPAPIPPG